MIKQDKKFVQDTRVFLQKDNEAIRKQNKIYLIVTILALIVAALAVLSVTFLTPLKTIEPYIVRVDNTTGEAQVLSTVPVVKKSYDQVIDEHFLSEYVKFRESYDWYTVGDYYRATLLMSEPKVAAYYKKTYGSNNQNSPVNILKKDFRIKIDINSINFIGDTAQIHFTKTKLPVAGPSDEDQIETYHYLAIVAYHYVRSKMNNEQRQINPLGFEVISYQVTEENQDNR